MKNVARLAGLVVLALAMVSPAAVVFSDDFSGVDGSAWDASKWDVAAYSGAAGASVSGGVGTLGTAGNYNFPQVWAVSTFTGTLSPGQSVTYSADILSYYGYNATARVWVDGAVTVFIDKTDWGAANVSVDVGGANVWTGSGVPTGFSITLTDATYAISLPGTSTDTGSLNGTHSLASSYTGNGALGFFVQNNTGWAQCFMEVDNVAIDVVPEPMTLAMLAMGGLAMLRRRK